MLVLGAGPSHRINDFVIVAVIRLAARKSMYTNVYTNHLDRHGSSGTAYSCPSFIDVHPALPLKIVTCAFPLINALHRCLYRLRNLSTPLSLATPTNRIAALDMTYPDLRSQVIYHDLCLAGGAAMGATCPRFLNIFDIRSYSRNDFGSF